VANPARTTSPTSRKRERRATAPTALAGGVRLVQRPVAYASGSSDPGSSDPPPLRARFA